MPLAEAVGACQQPGISIATVALARGVNASMLRRWVSQSGPAGRPKPHNSRQDSRERTHGFKWRAAPARENRSRS